MEYFRKTGSIGGKTRAKKYTKKQLSEMGKKGGSKGGKMRLVTMTAERRSEVASLADYRHRGVLGQRTQVPYTPKSICL